jgi:hypothetical protein
MSTERVRRVQSRAIFYEQMIRTLAARLFRIKAKRSQFTALTERLVLSR